MTVKQIVKLAVGIGLALSLIAGSVGKTKLAKGEPQPGDDRGGSGHGYIGTLFAREAQPGDDRGGSGHGFIGMLMAREAQPGDDRGGVESQPGDDRGRGKGKNA